MPIKDITIFPKSEVDRKGFVRLYMYVSINGVDGWFPTKVKCLKDSWNQVEQKVSAGHVLYKKLNGKLLTRKAELQSVFDALDYEKIPPAVDIVRQRYNAILTHQGDGSKPKLKDYTFDEYWELYIDARRNTCSDKGYLRKFKPAMDHIKTVLGPKPTFDQITNQFYYDLLNHLFETCELESNTASGIIKKICSVMKSALIDPRTRHQYIPIDFQQFKDTYVKPKVVWLDWETELRCLESFDPLETDRELLDFFLFQCYTGLRHSDAYGLRKENYIKRNNSVYIDFTVVKTKLDQNLKLAAKAEAIAKKYYYNLPKIREDEVNAGIKKIAQAAGELSSKKKKESGLINVVEKVRFRGSERIVEMLPKYQMITTHTGRRSFGRRWLEIGEPIQSLQVYYGHSSIKQTEDVSQKTF